MIKRFLAASAFFLAYYAQIFSFLCKYLIMPINCDNCEDMITNSDKGESNSLSHSDTNYSSISYIWVKTKICLKN